MKSITIVATASVALTKLENLINILKEQNYYVNVIATSAAIKYFPKLKNIITLDINKYLQSPTEHINLAIKSDLFVVAPATANTISKFVNGIADSMALASLLAARQKILFAPAMNDKMLEGIIDRNHIEWLENNGHYIIGPNYGMLKEGYENWGRMSEPNEIVKTINNIIKPVLNKKIIVSYGASRKYIDPIRFVTNNSSGKFGKLIIKNLRLQGLDVKGIDASQNSNEEIYAKAKEGDIYVGCAALADFTFKQNKTKIKKDDKFVLIAKPTLDVIKKLALETKIKIVGFKIDENKNNALLKMKNLNLDLMIWNKLKTMNSDLFSGSIIFANHEWKINNQAKYKVAYQIAKIIKEKLV